MKPTNQERMAAPVARHSRKSPHRRLALAELGLIDEYEFVVQPRLVGHGPTLFGGRVDLRLVSRLEFDSGAVGRGPPFISFSTSWPELSPAVLGYTDNERFRQTTN
jgi:hypothetical protein